MTTLSTFHYDISMLEQCWNYDESTEQKLEYMYMNIFMSDQIETFKNQ